MPRWGECWRTIPSGGFNYGWLYAQVVAVAEDGWHLVEVGAWLGQSAVFMAEAIASSGKRIAFDAVDTWEGTPGSIGCSGHYKRFLGGDDDIYEAFLHHVARCGVADYVRPVRLPSVEAAQLYADGALDFVMIDADHSTVAVTEDLHAWWPKVRPGGLVAGHDYNLGSVYDAVRPFSTDQGIRLLVWWPWTIFGAVWAMHRP